MSNLSLNGIPLEYARCRAFGHSWEEYVPVGKRKGIGFRFSLLCMSCATERHDSLDSLGFLIPGGRQYDYPWDYSEWGGFSRAEYRVAYNKKRVKKRLARRGDLLLEVPQ